MSSETIQLLEENEFFLVLDKPEKVSIHNQSPSVAEFLQKRQKPLHFINRLDSETSGLVLVAQKSEYHQALAEAFSAGQKIYRALLRSPWKSAESEARWAWPLTDRAEGRKNPQGIKSEQKAAETVIQVLRTNRYFTEVQAEILTGRQHQIRKHAALAHHPIVGDARYNDEKYNQQIEKFYLSSRMHLHAEKIIFTWQGKSYTFCSEYSLDRFFNETGSNPV
jgi:23S rRNA-/tRNA-specific pseudouridylate synthase